eukprot:6804121-Karenia_brevis.AAC.1
MKTAEKPRGRKESKVAYEIGDADTHMFFRLKSIGFKNRNDLRRFRNLRMPLTPIQVLRGQKLSLIHISEPTRH